MAMQELRQTERIRSFLRAQIIFNNRMSTIDCTIKNISATGAKIAVSDTLTLPTEFELDIPQKGRTHRVRLVWRDKEAIGVEFLDAKAAGASAARESAAANPEQRLYELQLQNAELKAKIKRLRKRLEDLGQDPDIDA
jgi:hypothetical protein